MKDDYLDEAIVAVKARVIPSVPAGLEARVLGRIRTEGGEGFSGATDWLDLLLGRRSVATLAALALCATLATTVFTTTIQAREERSLSASRALGFEIFKPAEFVSFTIEVDRE